MILMHKDIPVAEVDFLKNQGLFVKDIYCSEHMPTGTLTKHNLLQNKLMESWYGMRAIPNERQGLSRIEKVLGCSVSDALIKSLSIGLTDTYWFKEPGPPLTWEDVNYYTNGFSNCLADAVIFPEIQIPSVSFNSLDLTTDGMLSKTVINMPALLVSVPVWLLLG